MMAQDSKLLSLRHQIMWDRMIATVEEQAQTLIRTAFSNTVREAGDLSAQMLRHYERRWKKTFSHELRVGYWARRVFEALGDQQVERLLANLLSPNIQDELTSSAEFSFDWHSRLILKAIGQREMLRVIKSFGPNITPLLTHLAQSRPS